MMPSAPRRRQRANLIQVKADPRESARRVRRRPNPATCPLAPVGDKVTCGSRPSSGAAQGRSSCHVFARCCAQAPLAGCCATEARSRKIDAGRARPPGASSYLASPTCDGLSQAPDSARPLRAAPAPSRSTTSRAHADTRHATSFELTKAIGAGDVPRALGCCNMLATKPASPALRNPLSHARAQMLQSARQESLATAPRATKSRRVGMSPTSSTTCSSPARRMSHAALPRVRSSACSSLTMRSNPSRSTSTLSSSRLVSRRSPMTRARAPSRERRAAAQS